MMYYLAAIYAFRKTSKRYPINILIKFKLKCLLLQAVKLYYYVTTAGINSARAMLEFFQKERYRSVRSKVKYSSLSAKNTRIDLLLSEYIFALNIYSPSRILIRILHIRFSRRFDSMISIIFQVRLNF